MKIPLLSLALLLLPWAASAAADSTIGFIEKFALAKDRERVLGDLIPGSEEFYFFHALHYQNSGQSEKLASTLEQWSKRFPSSEQRRIIENRSALIRYETDPESTLAYLKQHLNMSFHDEQESRERKPDLPDALNPDLITKPVFVKQALNSDSPQGVNEAGLEELVRTKTVLNPAQRTALLSRLQRPDIPELLPLVIEQLKTRESRGFGEFPIHEALLLTQLDELAKKIPALAENPKFVFTKIRKLAPDADKDLEYDTATRTAWLERVWGYVQTLPASFNSLKATVLYQRLQLDRSLGIYDKARFTEYLKLPRSANYVNPEWLRGNQNRVDVSANYGELFRGTPPIGNDEPLVREYLLELLQGEPSWEPWAAWLKEGWLKQVFAEAKIVHGIGQPEEWASLIAAQQYQALKERVDVDFAPTNARFALPEDPASVTLWVKNVGKLIIKIYEINTFNFFVMEKRQLNTDLSLDGLVANKEETYDLGAENPFLRVKKTFDFAELKGKQGAWVIEFIGGGKSSRALLRRGELSLLQERGPAGDLLTILDEKKNIVPDGFAWFEGRRFESDPKTGRILIPYSAEPGKKLLVLANAGGEFASLAEFEHHAETYQLNAQFYIEREQLIERADALLAVRAELLNGAHRLPIELLTETKLSLTVVTLDGISTTQEVANPKLTDKKVFTHLFSVPDRTASISARLTGKVEAFAQGGEKQTLSDESEISINGIDRTALTYDIFLSRFGEEYVLEVLGKNGEPAPDQPMQVRLKHRNFEQPVHVSLRTNEQGRSILGALEEIEEVQAEIPGDRSAKWPIKMALRTPISAFHALVGEEIRIPWNGKLEAFSLLELRSGLFVREVREALSMVPGFVVVKNLPPGDYSISARGPERLAGTIRVTAGKAATGWLLSSTRGLNRCGTNPLQITAIENEGEDLLVSVANANPFTRVHVAATRFVPEAKSTGGIGLYYGLADFARPAAEVVLLGSYPNVYTAGRQIGDEYRYILERRYALKLPGNMLRRPGLVLNPWEVRVADEQTDLKRRVGQDYGAGAGGITSQMYAPEDAAETFSQERLGEAGSSLNFLAEPAPVLYNLIPDASGLIRVPRKDFKDRQHLQIYAENLTGAVWRTVTLSEVPTKFRDLRLKKNLDPQKPFTETKAVTVLKAGESLKVEDISTSTLETYDTLAGIYRVFTALNPSDNLAKFEWILLWPELGEKEKLAKYSEFASHELSFFLFKKDKAFFDKVILPYLKNKKDKTFMDDFLLGNNLSGYLNQWQYARLNIPERCLLAQRIAEERASTARQIRELWELVPPNPELADRLFETALRGGLLAASGEESSFAAGKKAALSQNEEIVELSPPPPPAPAAAPAEPSDRAEPKAEASKENAAHRQKRGMPPAAAGTGFDEEAADFAPMDTIVMMAQPDQLRPFYRKLGPTKVWAENNYYNLTITEQNGSLIPINEFWKDYALWDGKSPFLSQHVAAASGNFTEMILALAILDLPFQAKKPESRSEENSFTLTASGPTIAFHKQITEALRKENGGLLVSQNFFRHGDRYRTVGNEQFDKFVTEEFLAGAVYGANIVVTNPASSPQKVEILLQIPKGSLPVLSSKPTNTLQVRLEPYSTQTFSYHFYFPYPAPENSRFPHYPVQVAQGKEVLGAAKPFDFFVVPKLTQFDKGSWDYISQEASEEEVFAFLAQTNLQRIDFAKVAWRCRNSAPFFQRLVKFMGDNHCYSDAIYRYAVYHHDAPALGEWLKHQVELIENLGDWLSTKLLVIDPIQKLQFEIFEFAPLVNQRRHKFGSEYQVANSVVLEHYRSFLRILSYKQKLDPMDQLSVVYFLFLQDRVSEALERFASIPAESLSTQVQYDYFRCYANFYLGKPEEARKIASWHAGHPVNRWREKFAEVLAQVDEIEGKAPQRQATAEPDRAAQQESLAASEPSFDFHLAKKAVFLSWNQLSEVTINYYVQDPEFSFSASPFVAQQAGQFLIVKPTLSILQPLPNDVKTLEVPIPAEYAKLDLMVEVVGRGVSKSQPYHSNNLKIAVAENYGIVEVRKNDTGKALGGAYVKVYAQLTDGGEVRFYKDGYTDLRGKFDYASLNTAMGSGIPRPVAESAKGTLDHPTLMPSELRSVSKLAILILSEENGAEVREVHPPSE